MAFRKGLLETAESIFRGWVMVKKTAGIMFQKPDDPGNIYRQMSRVGYESLPIVLLSALFTGMVLALQSGVASTRLFDQAIFMGTLVSFSIVLELGPVLTAIVVAGRVGASVTAEIGSMKVSEQIDALYTLGTTPEKYLVAPLFISMLLMLPVITLFANITGVFGGYVIAVSRFSVPGSVYINDIITHLTTVHVAHGLIKSFFFAFIIASVSCYNGLSASGGASGVGRSTTRAVVISIVSILISDYFLSSFLTSVGLI